MKVVVTGAAGFLGRRIVQGLLSEGVSVRATDRPGTVGPDSVEFVAADIRDGAGLTSVFGGMSAGIHAAGLAHVFGGRRSREAPFREINEEGTAHVVRAAARAGVRRLVLVSSVSVYGPSGVGLRDEAAACRPEGPYAESKLAAERKASEIAGKAGMELVILRLATLFGEGDPGNVLRLIRWVESGRFVWIGDGGNRKSLLHVTDAARATVMAAVGGSVRDEPEVFNVSAAPLPMKEVVDAIAGSLGRHAPGWRIPVGLVRGLLRLVCVASFQHRRARQVEDAVRKWVSEDAYDGRRFERWSGFSPRVDPRAGIREEVEWYLREKGQPAARGECG